MIHFIPLWLGTVLGWVIFYLTLWVDVYTDGKLAPFGAVNHLRGAILRVPVLTLVIALLGIWSTPVVLFGYWASMDMLMGWTLHRDIFYLGDRSKLDLLQKRYKAIVWVKFLGVTIGLFIYIFKTF